MAIFSSTPDPLPTELASHNIDLSVCNSLVHGNIQGTDESQPIEPETYPSEEVSNYWTGVQKFNAAMAFYYAPTLKDHDLRSLSSEAFSAFIKDADAARERMDDEELGNMRLFKTYRSLDHPLERWTHERGWPDRSYMLGSNRTASPLRPVSSSPPPSRKRPLETIEVDEEDVWMSEDELKQFKNGWGQSKTGSPTDKDPRVQRDVTMRMRGKRSRHQ